MKAYKIIYKAKPVGLFYVEANSIDEALAELRPHLGHSKIDFNDIKLIACEDMAEEIEE